MIAMRMVLRGVRAAYKQPALDTKIITSWNALMIAGLAAAARELNEPRLSRRSRQAADYLPPQACRERPAGSFQPRRANATGRGIRR